MHKDTWGIILLIIVLFGAFYGRGLPALIPQVLLFVSIGLLLYRGFFIKSKYALLYTASIWICISWLAGKSMEEAWGNGFLMEATFVTVLLITPVVTFIHQRIYRRMNPVPKRGLEIETEREPIKFNFSKLKKLFCKTIEPEKPEEIELITFDLGKEIKHINT